MRTADGGDQAVLRRLAARDGLAPRRDRAAPPARREARMPRLGLAEEQAVLCRRIDHAAHRHAVLDFGDVDRELAVAADEFLGAVQRIDQEEADGRSFGMRPAATSSSATIGNAGRQLREPLEDEALGFVIGVGHRRMVGLRWRRSPGVCSARSRLRHRRSSPGPAAAGRHGRGSSRLRRLCADSAVPI